VKSDGNQDSEISNGLAKIYIETNYSPKEFLMNNLYYNPKIIGKFCEEQKNNNPMLAFLAYNRAKKKMVNVIMN